MTAVTSLSATVGLVAACAALGFARATYYRRQPFLGGALNAVMNAQHD